MIAHSLIVQVSVSETSGMIIRKRPVPFASEPTAPVLAQRQGGQRVQGGQGEGNPTTASLNSYSNLGCWSDTTARILSGCSTVGSDVDVEYCQTLWVTHSSMRAVAN